MSRVASLLAVSLLGVGGYATRCVDPDGRPAARTATAAALAPSLGARPTRPAERSGPVRPATPASPVQPVPAAHPAPRAAAPAASVPPPAVAVRPRAVLRYPTPSPLLAASFPTGWRALDAAIAALPAVPYVPVRWVISAQPWWGTADVYLGVVYISPRTPPGRLTDVALHEWAHMLAVQDYGGGADTMMAALDGLFGGSGTDGAEAAADCMARLLGAQWTHYTDCPDPLWRVYAERLLAGLPA